MRMVESSDVDKIQRPSADQARSVMVLRWPRSSRTMRPTSVSKTRMQWSSQEAARSVESRCWRSAATGAHASRLARQ